MNTQEPRLGVDFGRVINDGSSRPGAGDTVFLNGDLEAALRTPAMPGALDVLPRLVTLFGGRVWVVSKCGERIQRRTLQWLDHHDFWDRTAIPRDHIRFCRRRPEKAVHCAELGITHFIDDRVDVHHALRGLVPHLYLFGEQAAPAPTWLRHTLAWPDAERAVTADLGATRARG